MAMASATTVMRFPNDPTESVDTDGDGVGDNGDAFPTIRRKSVDTDGDGLGNNDAKSR